MDRPLYLEDPYLNEFESKVVSVNNGKEIVLENTAFYPTSGGQPYDTGTIRRRSDGQVFKVTGVRKNSGTIIHEVSEGGLSLGDEVAGRIDWPRRFKLMKSHTSAHVVSEIVHREANAMITGNQLEIDKIRIDYSAENYDAEALKSYITKANEVIARDLAVKGYFMTTEEALQTPNLTKLAKGLPPDLKEIHIIEIGDFEFGADGGTHVKSTKEIGELEFLRSENKGKTFRRLYYKIKD